MATPVAVGIDNGGTWIRFKGLNPQGRCIWSLKKPSPSVDNLPVFLKKTLKRFHGNLAYLSIGSKGVWKQSKRRRLKRELMGLAQHIVVMSDVEAAWLAAFKSEGILIISGTGSIAYGRRADGTFARAGGLGPLKGDEGSGFWIGKKWCDARNRKKTETKSVRQIAQWAPLVLRKATLKNSQAVRIVDEAQQQLASIAKEVAITLHWKGIIPLSVGGSVLQNNGFKKGFLRRMRKTGLPFRYRPSRTGVAYALAYKCIMTHGSR